MILGPRPLTASFLAFLAPNGDHFISRHGQLICELGVDSQGVIGQYVFQTGGRHATHHDCHRPFGFA